jgi:hypothetical protein
MASGSRTTRASGSRSAWSPRDQCQDVTLVPTWRAFFGPDMAGEVLLPGADARLGTVTFADWLAAGAP